MRKRRNLAGISLLEILISMLILVLVLVGLGNVFVSSKGYLAHNYLRVVASQLGTRFLSPLQNEVNQSSWDQIGNNLSVRTNILPAGIMIKGIAYNYSYVIDNTTDLDPATTLRRVNVTISWNENRQ